ncbi:MAG TPA: S8 family serine peptidase [Actinomycetota bacterium]
MAALVTGRARRTLTAGVLAFVALLASAPAVQALGELVPVIVVGPNADSARRATVGQYGEVDYELPIVDGVYARVPESRIDDLARTTLVFPDRAMSLQSNAYGGTLETAYPVEVGARSLWDEGVTGDGVTVALVDTGVAMVPDLADHVVATANLTKEAEWNDTYGHGTFQAGLIAGDGTSSGGRYTGVAPDASLLSVKVAGATGETSLGQVLAGVQVVSESLDEFNVRVLLLALDSESPLPPDLDPLSWALRALWSSGVVVVVPAGNDGPDEGTIASPGEDPWLLTAGAVDDLGTTDVDDDLVADYSSRGPTRWGQDKPDLAAPGSHLVSLRAPGSTVDVENPSAVVEDAYFKGSGTSMAAAVTAGSAALLAQARPELSPDEVKALLTGTAAGIADGDVHSTGSGVVDAAAAAAFDGDLPELPSADPVETAELPGERNGFQFKWQRDGSGVYRWVAVNGNGSPKSHGRLGDEDFEARQWAARQWAARQWLARQWEARQWLARQWAARQWAARQWAARQWAARQWTARRWDARQWAARQWTARQWDARQWAARQWTARQWTQEEWLARQWSARQWSDESWDARQWSARQWSARQWNARQWNAVDWT